MDAVFLLCLMKIKCNDIIVCRFFVLVQNCKNFIYVYILSSGGIADPLKDRYWFLSGYWVGMLEVGCCVVAKDEGE